MTFLLKQNSVKIENLEAFRKLNLGKKYSGQITEEVKCTALAFNDYEPGWAFTGF